MIQKYFETEEWESDYDNSSAEIKVISDYSGLSFNEIMDLPLGLFLLYRKDAWIYNNLKSESGRVFLKDLVRFKTTEPDMDAIHAFKGGV